MDLPSFSLNITDDSLKPVYRRLRGYAFDPSFATKLDSLKINTVVYPIRWEKLEAGPIGEYIEVIDVDPASGVYYPPVDLNDPELMVQDGLPPSESNPQFHQQMVYAVAMTTIQNFEKALGRAVQWSSTGSDIKEDNGGGYVQRLRIYPHAIRDANAYYSPDKKAVLFGYFSARAIDESILMPGSLVFTCLSHDIISHEVTHALIDGIYKGYAFPVHEDTLGLHEAFSDLVALFQHFTFPEVLIDQIAKTRGELKGPQLLSQLAQQFGLAVGNYSALRDAIGQFNEQKQWEPVKPDPKRYLNEKEPHSRGSILVAAVFDAFLNIYQHRTNDLNLIASNGTGILPEGQLSPSLVRRLAFEAARTAKQFLSLCIRALDYCPPIGTSFGEFLRALITADVDLVADDTLGYRVSIIESFKRWGIYPKGIRNLSVENLTYYAYTIDDFLGLDKKEQERRLSEQKHVSFKVNFLHRLDILMLDTYFAQSEIQKFTEEARKSGINPQEDYFTKYLLDVLKSFYNLKADISNLLEGSPEIDEMYPMGRKEYLGVLAPPSDYITNSAASSNAPSFIRVGFDRGSAEVDEKVDDLDSWLYQFTYLCHRFYNETGRHLTNRKRQFLISQEYKRRFRYLFNEASINSKEKLQVLTGLVFQPAIVQAILENGCLTVNKNLSATLPGTLLHEASSFLFIDRIYQPGTVNIDNSPEVRFEVHTLHRAQRVGPDANVANRVLLTLMQRFMVSVYRKHPEKNPEKLSEYEFSGGCTMAMDVDKRTIRIIPKPILDLNRKDITLDTERLSYELRQRYQPILSETTSPFAASRWPIDSGQDSAIEPFALLHQRS